jgi:hypothetical protein
MEQNSQQHFTTRNQRIDSFRNLVPAEKGHLHTPKRVWNGPSTERLTPPTSPPHPTSGSPGIEQQRFNEVRNLDHRLGQAEHLRQLSESNGNSRLAETANRMQERAQQHFAVRNQHIDSLQKRASTQNGYQHIPQQHVATPNGQQYGAQNRLSTQTGYQRTPHHPAVRQAQAISPRPHSTPKKPSMLDRMRGLWPFK